MKKKVCILKTGDVTFISRIHRTAQALQETNNYEVTIVSITPRSKIKEDGYSYKMLYVDVKSRVLKNSIFTPIRILEGLFKLFIIALNQRANIYVAIGIEDLISIYFISKLTDSKFVYSANELEADRKRVSNNKLNIWINKIVVFFEKRVLKSAQSVIAADTERAKLMQQLYDIKKVEVIRNVPIPEDIPASDLIRKSLDLPKSNKILLYQGMLSQGRGLEAAIKACSGTSLRKLCLVLLGFISESYKKELIDLAKQNSFNKLYFILPVSWRELLQWTKSADISIVLIENISRSYYLAAPNKLYESIMVGVPYIASNFPEIKHVHSITKGGILVNPENITEISEAIYKLIENDEFYKKCQLNELKAKEIFNWGVEKRSLIEIFDKIKTK